jgi:hypothetical protein
MQKAVIISCHQSLLHLGDLSRYREAELKTNDRNWGPAIGYYDLANAIYRSSGASFNQLAVIALSEGNNLNATYYLYRSLSTEEPHPTALGNLEVEYKSILKLAKEDKNTRSILKPGLTEAIFAFLQLHVRCRFSLHLPEPEDWENEFISQLPVEIKELTLSSNTLCKITLVNIAAEALSAAKLQENPDDANRLSSFFIFFLRLNVRTFFMLLQVLQQELEGFSSQGNRHDSSEDADVEKLSAVTRRILPALRHYSSWIVKNANILAANLGDPSLEVQKKELWKIYANTMTLLAGTFEIGELVPLEYLLEEDEDTLGFKPFQSNPPSQRYITLSGSIKPDFHAVGVERAHPNIEMQTRIRGLLVDGLNLAQTKVTLTVISRMSFHTNEKSSNILLY